MPLSPPIPISPMLWGLFLLAMFGILLYNGIMKSNNSEVMWNIQILVSILALLYFGTETLGMNIGSTMGSYGGGYGRGF